ncbi:MAG: ABC transporter permease, partial [Rubrobacteraceae bacterium]
MLASFRAEILKLRKRPAMWVLGLVWVTVVMLFGYVLTYSFVANAPPPPDDIPKEAQVQQEDFNQSQIEALMPESLLQNMFGGGFFGIGAAIVLILGALVAGSEYGWGTMKTI